MSHPFLAALALCLAGCAHARSEPAPLERSGALAVLHVPHHGPVPRGVELPVAVRVDADSIVCTRDVDGPSIPYITFESDGARSAYGVYALFGPKNGLPVPHPLAGDPIAWPDRDHARGLALLLARAGIDEAAAAALVRDRGGDWFGAGLRVFCVLERAFVPRVLPGKSDGVEAVLVCYELR